MSTANSLTSGLDCASPESIMDPTQRTAAGDQYSLGCVLYFCLTGQYPFPEGTAVEKMMAHQTKQPPPIKDASPETPDELVAVVDRLMQKTPAARYGSVAEAMEALRPLASESPAPGSKYTAQPIVQVPPNGLATLAPEATRPAPAPSRTAVAASTAAPARSTTVPPASASAPPLSTRPAMPPSTPAMPTRDRLLIPTGVGADHGSMPSKYAMENLSDPPKSLEERLGTTGLVVAAFAMAVVAFLVFYLFMNK